MDLVATNESAVELRPDVVVADADDVHTRLLVRFLTPICSVQRCESPTDVERTASVEMPRIWLLDAGFYKRLTEATRRKISDGGSECIVMGRDLSEFRRTPNIYRLIEKPIDGEVLCIYIQGAHRSLEESALRRKTGEFYWLIDNIAHEVRTCLQEAEIAAFMLQGGGADQVDASVQILNRRFREITRMVGGIQSFAKGQKHTQDARFSEDFLAPLVEELVRVHRGSARFNDRTLTCHIDPALPRVLLDADNCLKVLRNLLKNAAEATPVGGVIEVRLFREGDEVVLTVADNGVGMPPEVLSRIFKPYFTTKGANGNGVGLALARQVMLEHGGRLECTSEPGKGAKFVARFPIPEKPT